MGFLVCIGCSFNTDLLNNYRMGRLMASFTYQDINDGLKRISDATTEVVKG